MLIAICLAGAAVATARARRALRSPERAVFGRIGWF